MSAEDAAAGMLQVARTLKSSGDSQDDTLDTYVAYALNAKRGYRDADADTTYVTGFNHTGGGSKSPAFTEDATPPLDSSNDGVGVIGSAVRRLTPVECERLQGLPDDWTRIPNDAPDSRRYAALGDAVTVPVAEWIGRRLVEAAA